MTNASDIRIEIEPGGEPISYLVTVFIHGDRWESREYETKADAKRGKAQLEVEYGL